VARFTSFIYFVADYFEGLGLFGICRLESLRSRLHKRLRVLRPFPIVFSAPWEKEKVAGFGQRQGVILQRCPLLVGLGRIKLKFEDHGLTNPEGRAIPFDSRDRLAHPGEAKKRSHSQQDHKEDSPR
jgi:hypothetical protein